jgi:hypothetical protein
MYAKYKIYIYLLCSYVYNANFTANLTGNLDKGNFITAQNFEKMNHF